MSTESSLRRLGVLTGVSLALFGILFSRLYFLQIMSPDTYTETAVRNRTRTIYTEAPRGRIYDAKMRLLAGRRESLVVTLDWTQLQDLELEERESIYLKVALELNKRGLKTKVSDLEREFKRNVNGALKPAIVAEDVGIEAWVAIKELGLPGFTVERSWVRTYPYGEIGANILGYVGEVTDGTRADELTTKTPDKLYQAGDEVGLAGIEMFFESDLRGIPEYKTVEINAQNRVVRDVEVHQAAIPGNDIVLAIDIDKQYVAEQILADELELARKRDACKDCLPHVARSGALVALDVNDGTVQALATYPSYDPASLVYGMSQTQADFLLRNSDKPMFNRPVEGLYPAGSTFKIIPAYAALTSGARGEWYEFLDEGVYTLETCETGGAGCSFQNAGALALGPVDMRRALTYSSDTYFYSLGETFWGQRSKYGETIMQDVAADFGVGTRSGIELPRERSGRLPTPEWKRSLHDENPEAYTDPRWYTGNNVNLAIGQGDLLVTPLQLANMYAMLANRGTRYQPRLVDRKLDGESGEVVIQFTPKVAIESPLDPAAWTAINEGLQGVPLRGTAREAFETYEKFNYPIAGKTGTAQVTGKADYSLFAAYGPLPSSRYAAAAVLEEAGFGGDAAAPAVRRLLEYLFGIVEIPEAPLADGERLPIDRPQIVTTPPAPDADEPAPSGDPSPQQPSPEASPTTSTTEATTTVPATEPSTTTTLGPTTTAATAPPATEPEELEPPPAEEPTTTGGTP